MTDPTCPVCDGGLTERNAALWCDRCHTKCVTCCEGAPQTPMTGGPA